MWLSERVVVGSNTAEWERGKRVTWHGARAGVGASGVSYSSRPLATSK